MDIDWNRRYTHDSLVEELNLLERHYRDGSWRECTCMPEKHLPTIAGLSSEMVMFVKTDREKDFFANMADVARKLRLAIEDNDYTYLPSNPHRAYLPHGLTQYESAHPSVTRKLSRCIRAVEASCKARTGATYSPACNPAAICRSRIEK